MNSLLFKNWARKWIEDQKLFVKESTYSSYVTNLENHIIPRFGDMELSEITEDSIQQAALYWLHYGRIDKKGGLSEKTVKDIVMILKLCIKAGIRGGYIPKIDLHVAFPPSNKIEKIKVLDSSSYQKLVQSIYLNLNCKSLGILFCLHTGIRIGEICALQWKDINMDKQTVFINKTIQRLYLKNSESDNNTKIIITTPKTKTSIREIPISSVLMPVLQKLYNSNNNAYLISNTEKYIEPRTYREYFTKFLKANNIDHINFHGIRHTFATRCIESGADYKTVSELLGHATVNMTLNLYVHPRMEQKRKCVEMISYML